MKKSFNAINISLETLEYLLEMLKELSYNIIICGVHHQYSTMEKATKSKEFHSFSHTALIQETDSNLIIKVKMDGFPSLMQFDLNEDVSFTLTGQNAYTQLARAYKPKDLREDEQFCKEWLDDNGKFVCSASPIINYNPEYQNRRIYDAYEYDINSAYFATILDKIPDTYNMRQKDFVNEDEIGFDFITRRNESDEIVGIDFMLVHQGIADYVAPLIETPQSLKDFCHKWYAAKSKAREKRKALQEGTPQWNEAREDELNAKAMLNLPIGYCQRINPFFRAYVVCSCNEKIAALIDEDTLFWNTDAIFTKKPRPDLDCGDNIGQFKVERIESIYYKGNTYQLGHDLPVWRHVPKQWFKSFEKINGRPFDLEYDAAPPRMNKYIWDENTLTIKVNEEINYV